MGVGGAFDRKPGKSATYIRRDILGNYRGMSLDFERTFTHIYAHMFDGLAVIRECFGLGCRLSKWESEASCSSSEL